MSKFISDKLKSLFKSGPAVVATAEAAMKPSPVAAASVAQKVGLTFDHLLKEI